MPEEIRTIVRIPLSEIEESIRAKHHLPNTLAEVRIEGEFLIFSFIEKQEEESDKGAELDVAGVRKRRRSLRRRNRMKTRGWEVVARFTNSKGQKCAIYKPFVTALDNSQLTIEEQRKVVEKILRSNRNRPSDESIQYFLENTLEYLKNRPFKHAGSPVIS